ncbi:MAG: tellurite resistance TerB family protein [Parvularculaceae bacterium]|nr:tellurite resistance TerB family protein [Parvularculaceae bacterium]
MFDARKILADLQQQAGALAKDYNVDQRLDQAKGAAGQLRERLKTDPKAQTIAAGAGGLLLLGLLGSKGGRKLFGNVAKTGAVAALGALAYKAWSERQGRPQSAEPTPQELKDAGYIIEHDRDAEFSESLLHAMLGAAWADGALDPSERETIEAALSRAGASADDRQALMNDMPEPDRLVAIAKGAKTPNHAAELFAAAAAVAGDRNGSESQFLRKLADKLTIHPDHADAILKAAS